MLPKDCLLQICSIKIMITGFKRITFAAIYATVILLQALFLAIKLFRQSCTTSNFLRVNLDSWQRGLGKYSILPVSYSFSYKFCR